MSYSADAVFVGAERELKLLVEGLLGDAGAPMEGRISVGWPDEDWMESTPCPRAVVLMQSAKILSALPDGQPDKLIAIDVEDDETPQSEAWYKKADALMSCVVAFQTNDARVNLDKYTGTLVDGIEQGLVFPTSGDFASEFRVEDDPEIVSVPPISTGKGRVFERHVRFIVSGPLYRVETVYTVETVEGEVAEGETGD
jgi:hypothetical protein